MRLEDDALREFWRRDGAEIRSSLRGGQPDAGDARAFWWENLATRALRGVYEAQCDADRHEYARLVVVMTEEAMAQSAIGECEGAIRLAHLASFCHSVGKVDDVPLDIDSIVNSCLYLIEVPLDIAVAQVGDWRTLRIEQIRALRVAKNLLTPCREIRDLVVDQELADRLSEWLMILDDLP